MTGQENHIIFYLLTTVTVTDSSLAEINSHWARWKRLQRSTYQIYLDSRTISNKKVKVAHTRLPSVGFRSWSRFLAVSLQVMWVTNPAVGCHYFPPGPQLPSQPWWGLLSVSLLGEQRHDGCEQFAQDCYPTASRLRFEPRPYCPWV